MQTELGHDVPALGTSRASYGMRVGQLLIPWLPAVLVMVCAGVASASPIAGDSWLALVGGREIVQHGLPSHDMLSSLGRGRSWIDEEWLSQVAFYGVYTIGGLGAVVVLSRLLVTVAELVALGTAGRRRSSPLAITLALLMAFALLGGRNEVRPQLLAEPLFALLLWILVDEVRRATPRALWATPLILVVWANVHGSVLLGSALVLLAMLFELGTMLRRRSSAGLGRVGWLTGVAVVAPFASPYRLHLIDYYRSVLDNGAFARYLTEWARSTPSSAPIECALVAVVLLFVAWQWRRAHLFDAVVLVSLAAATLLAQRNAVWLGLGIAALLPPFLDGIIPSRLQLREVRGAAVLLLGATLVGIVMLTRLATAGDASLDRGFPPSADAIVSAAARDPQADVLATPALGDWLLYREPSLAGRVVADGRFEVLSSSEFVRLMYVLGGYRSPAATFPRARILALSPGAGLVARARALPGARTTEQNAQLVVITLPNASG